MKTVPVPGHPVFSFFLGEFVFEFIVSYTILLISLECLGSTFWNLLSLPVVKVRVRERVDTKIKPD